MFRWSTRSPAFAGGIEFACIAVDRLRFFVLGGERYVFMKGSRRQYDCAGVMFVQAPVNSAPHVQRRHI